MDDSVLRVRPRPRERLASGTDGSELIHRAADARDPRKVVDVGEKRRSERDGSSVMEVVIGKRTRKNDRNVYVLGAGFSVDAGLPTVANFLNHMRDAADWLTETHNENGMRAVAKVLEFRHSAAAAGYRINIDLDNVEDLFSLASALPAQQLRRAMQTAIGATLHYSEVHGVPREVRMRILRGASWPVTTEWLARVSRISSSGQGEEGSDDVFCSIYDYYAAILAGRTSDLRADDNVVLTFNYDLLLEDSLATLGIPFTYGLGSDAVVYDESARCRPTGGTDILTVLKLHGSLNWYQGERTPLTVCGSFNEVPDRTPYVVPPTWDKDVAGITQRTWSAAVEALRQATRVIIIGFSFRVIDAHFKYLLAAGLMNNSALRKIVVIDPQASKLANQIRSVIRRDQFKYGIVDLHDRRLHEFAMTPDDLEGIGRPLRHGAMAVIELEREVRLLRDDTGFYVDPKY
ncbi:MAG TPA: SIR2 family protein [Vicinamibacterales bacterium]|jgi:hypothetical protein